MSFDPARLAQLRAALDKIEALALLKRSIAAASVTGDEEDFVGLLASELSALGTDNIITQDFAPGRPNVWAVLRGEGAGRF